MKKRKVISLANNPIPKTLPVPLQGVEAETKREEQIAWDHLIQKYEAQAMDEPDQDIRRESMHAFSMLHALS